MSKSPIYIGAGSSSLANTAALGIIDDSEDIAKERATAAYWATKTDGTVVDQVTGSDSGEGSSKAYAVGGTGVTTTANRGSAKEWATASGLVDTVGYSSKEHAQSTTAGTDTYGGSAKGWAITAVDTAIPGAGASDRSALHYSTAASNSATAAKASADSVASVIDYFDDKFLGSMADTDTYSYADTTGTWAINSSVITVASATNIVKGMWVAESGSGTAIQPESNVIAIDGTSITISSNMAASGSNVSIMFRGRGINDDFDSSKDGPPATNDGGALADGMLYFNTTDDTMKVYDSTAEKWKQLTPTTAEQTNIDAAVGNATDISKVAAIDSDVTTVAGIDSDVTAVAADATDIETVAGKATEIGLLGTSAMATASTGHLARLGTADVTADMALLGTADCVADMALLGTSDCVADMALLATTDCIADMNLLATNACVLDMALLGTADTVLDMALLGTTDCIADMALLATTDVIADLDTVATNISSVNDFADKYRIAGSAPGSDNDDGDLYYNTATNQLNVYDGSSWGSIGLTQVQTQTEANNAAVAMSIALG